MASARLILVAMAAICLFGTSSVSACSAGDLTSCMSGLQEMAGSSDMKAACKKMTQVVACLKDVKATCSNDQIKSTLEMSLKQVEQTIPSSCRDMNKGSKGGSSNNNNNNNNNNKDNGGNGSGSFSPSTLLIMGASVLMAAHFHL